MTPPTTTLMSGRPRSRRWAINSGTRVLWPAARLEAPTTSTFFSTASRALSSGVWKSGPGTMSKPRSAEAALDRADAVRRARPGGIVGPRAAVNALDRRRHGAVTAERILERRRDLA